MASGIGFTAGGSASGHDDAPPSYSEAMQQPGETDSPSRSTVAPGAGSAAKFRYTSNSFNIYAASKWSWTTCYLGEHRSSALYMVTFSPSAPTTVTIHDGLGMNDPVLATSVDVSNQSGNRWDIWKAYSVNIPPNPTSQAPSQTEILVPTTAETPRFKWPIFTFSIETNANNGQRESFEWHQEDSRGNVLKLVRAANRTEILAKIEPHPGSMTKMAEFKFLGGGRDGVLGPRWEIMTITTCITLWKRMLDQLQD
ncbi:hypothetical protein BX600DRAFT_470329 [Xylariales sp. PMI_506]|nr:hypothetical protein BX600DRAFT_470329 [Xylariales sp. PMI_506]